MAREIQRNCIGTTAPEGEEVWDGTLDTEKAAEILRREYGELEVMIANRDLALRMHSDIVVSIDAACGYEYRPSIEIFGENLLFFNGLNFLICGKFTPFCWDAGEKI